MREKLLSLPLTELKALAKAGGVKGITGLKKEELVDLLIEVDEKRKEEAARESAKARKLAGKATRVSVITNKDKTGERAPKKASFEESKEEKSAVAESSGEKYGEQKAEGKIAEQRPEGEAPARAPISLDTYIPQEGDTLVEGILEVMSDGFGFIRSANYLPGDNDVYVSPQQIRGFRLRTGDILTGIKRAKGEKEKFSPLSFLERVNGRPAKETLKRVSFENLTPIFPDKRIKLETPGCKIAMRAMDLVSPVGYGQRGMIVSPPKAGKTTLLKEIAHSMLKNDPETHMIILLIDERPEEVTDIKEAIIGKNVEVIYSTFDEQPEHHIRVAEMVIERARRLVEQKEDVVILLDSITRLTRAYNQVIPPSGRTLSGGLDPAALHMPKRFFGAARNMREGGSLTILATALVETGSKMDDVVYEEFKGTGNMEIVLDRKLSERRIFPAIDLAKSGTRREDLLLETDELEAINVMRKALNGLKPDEATDRILDLFAKTRNNAEFVRMVKSNKFL
ncbi:MAG: transcription termination factor Rho [Lachnospiraceae bacterium]|nr:transcription termination factor Rho [Lachnospiraceae bacterium]